MNISSKLKRVKAQADHLFLRGERTDVVGDLRAAEDQADNLKVLCEALKTAIEKTLHTHNTPEEKRIRKVNESHGAEALKDALHQLSLNSSSDQQPDQPLPNNTLLRDIVEQAAESQQGLSLEVLHYDKRIEEEVLRPLTTILQRDFSNWSKLRKQLKQVGQELDAARSRFRNSSGSASVAVSATTAARTDTLKEEMEDAESRLDQVKDNYACELFLLLSKERELCELVERFLQIRQDRFIKSQSLLSTVLPKLERQLACSSTGPVYGIRLDQHLKLAQKKVAVPIEVCLRRLAEVGIQEEGLFRMAGSATKVKRLRGAFDANLVDAATFVSAGDEYQRDYDVHVLAGTFKLYLRELPEPLLTYTLHAEWLEAARTPDRDEKLKKLWSAVKKLPGPNFDNLSFVIQFFSLLASHQSHNKMTPNNIAIVIAPNLIWSPEDNKQEDVMGTLGRNMSLGTLYRQIVEQLVECSDYFFGGNVIDFGVSRGEPESSDVSGNSVLNGSMPHASGMINNLGGGGGGQQQPSYVTLPRGHNRNRSADFKLDSSLSGITFDNKFQADASCESPKHPQRRKKQAPLPPQGSGGSRGTNDNSQGNSSSSSPEQPRSHPPPRSEIPAPIPPFNRTYPALPVSAASAPFKSPPVREGPTPPVATARLHHTGSIRRPNIEPPKPPVPSVGLQQPQPRTEKPLLQQIPATLHGLVSGTGASSQIAYHDRVDSSGTSAGVGSSCRSPPPRPQPPSTSALARGVMTTTSKMSASVESSSMSSSSLSSDGPPSASMTESGGSVTAPQQSSLVESSFEKATEGRCLEESSIFSVGHHPSPIISAAITGFGTSSPAGDSQHSPLKPPIGFEHFDNTVSPAIADIEMHGSAVVFRNKNLDDSSEVFTQEGLQEGEDNSPSNLLASSKTFRKSLENVIQQQASGQPLVLPRHQVVESSSNNNNNTEENVDLRESAVQDFNAINSEDDGTALEQKEEMNKVGFPVPAVRMSKEAMSACADRPEPANRSDKPALPEKPSTLPRPAVPDRPPLAPRPSSNPPIKSSPGVPAAATEPADPCDDAVEAGEHALERRQKEEADVDDVAGRDHSVEGLPPELQSTFPKAKMKSNNNTSSNSATCNNTSTSITNKINCRGGGATKAVISRKITPHFIGGSGVDTSPRQDDCGSERARSNTMSSSLESDMVGWGEETDRRQRSRSGSSITANASGKCISPGDILGGEKKAGVGGGSKVSQRIQAFAEKSLPSQNIGGSPPYLRSRDPSTTDATDKTSVGVRKSIHVLQDQLFRDSILQRARDGQCIIQKKKVGDDSTSSFTSTMDRPSTNGSAAATLLSRSLENLDQVTSSTPMKYTTAQTGRVASRISRSSLHSLGNKRLTSRNSGEGSDSGRRRKSHCLEPRNASFDQLLDESPSRFPASLAPPPPQFRDSGSEDSSSTAADDDDAVWQKRKRRSQELRKDEERSSSGDRDEVASNSNNVSPNTKRSSKKKNFPPPQPPPAQQEQQASTSFTPSRVAPKPPLAPKGSVVARTTSPHALPSGESVANSTDF